MPLALDDERMRQALRLAHDAIGVSDPNPRVGCVIGHQDGRVLGQGSTQQAGGPHAEVMALRDARAAGHDLRGATAWVTLEPCSHHGRTPPCCDALIEAGIARVVVAVGDPFVAVAGSGLRRLREAGVAVVISEGELAEQARELNIGFFSRHERGRPWVRLKLALSLDGRTALPDGRSQWITGPAARADGHAWRRRAGAVLTGIGTVLADDPRLDVRLVPSLLQPLRVVVDSSLRLPPSARLLAAPGRVLVFTTDAAAPGAAVLREAWVEIVECKGAEGRVDLRAVIDALGARGINEVHVEAGARLNAALLRTGCVDELLCYLAPVLLGPGHGAVDWPPLTGIAEAPRFRFVQTTRIGDDLQVLARPIVGATG